MEFIKKFSSLFGNSVSLSENCLLAFCIGTQFVRAAVFSIELGREGERTKAVIMGVGKAKIDKKEGDEKGEILEACQRARKEAENMADCQASQAIIGISSKPIRCSTTVVPCQRKYPQRPIDLAEMKNVIQKAQWRAFDELRRKEALECGLSETEIKLVDGKVLDIKIDGYAVVDPIGFRGKEIFLTILNVHASIFYLDMIQQIKKTLKIEIISLIPSSYAVLNSILGTVFKAIKIGEASSILIEGGGGATDVSVVHQGGFTGPKTVCLGGDIFTRRLESNFKLSKKEAEEIKFKYSKGLVSPQIKRRLTKLFNSDLKIWLDGVGAALSDFSGLKTCPGLILLFGEGCSLPGIEKALQEAPWRKEHNFLGSPKATRLKVGDIENVKDNTGLLDDIADISLLAIADFGSSLVKKKSTVDLILSRVIRLMQT